MHHQQRPSKAIASSCQHDCHYEATSVDSRPVLYVSIPNVFRHRNALVRVHSRKATLQDTSGLAMVDGWP